MDRATAARRIEFPYIPGLLSFREGPVVLGAIKKLGSPPDVLIFDGQGIAHPRRFGLACINRGWKPSPQVRKGWVGAASSRDFSKTR